MAKKKSPGQVPFSPTDDDRDLVALLAGAGIPHEVIVKHVKWPETADHHDAGKPISARTLRKVFREELDQGMAMANARVLKTAMSMVEKDRNPAVTIFWLKTRLGWKEPAQEVNLSLSYGQLVEQAVKQAAVAIARAHQQPLLPAPAVIEGEAKAA